MTTDADFCHRRGWLPGMRLRGVDRFGDVAVITITAIGRENVLAVDGTGEHLWAFGDRKWRRVPPQTETT